MSGNDEAKRAAGRAAEQALLKQGKEYYAMLQAESARHLYWVPTNTVAGERGVPDVVKTFPLPFSFHFCSERLPFLRASESTHRPRYRWKALDESFPTSIGSLGVP